ncbi:MAG: hypothetical protein JWQ76_5503 [Ramlibacter sp.]|nr:hypothetical protein [Ramlibacter sp.]
MRIALAFFGLPRRSDVTFPLIQRHLIAPLSARGELRIFHHLWRQDWIFNPRSGEDQAQPEANYAPFRTFEGSVENPPTQESVLLRRLRAYGDAWQDGFHSLGNMLLQLQSLLAVTQLAHAAAPDVVVFARPDLLYHEPVRQWHVDHVLLHPDAVLLPDWESWGGCNDRFAIAGARAFRAYGGRLLLADHFCERTGQAMHAETFLRYALAFAGVPVRTIAMRANRIRVDGRIQAEDFEGILSPLASRARTGPPGP